MQRPVFFAFRAAQSRDFGELTVSGQSFALAKEEMAHEAISFEGASEKQIIASPKRLNILISLSLAFLTAASILLLVYQSNRAVELRIETAEIWADYQARGLKAATDEDPNLKQQYSEEQDTIRRHAVELRELSNNAKASTKLSTYVTLLFLLGTAAAVVATFTRYHYLVYVGLLLGIVAIVLSFKILL